MSTISTTNFTVLQDLQRQIKELTKKGSSLEKVAQGTTELIYQQFNESVVLTRLYVTIPFGKLPPFNQNFVAKLKAIAPHLNDKTPILSLLGTSGDNPNWNNRLKSQGHVGIPLLSASFIEEIPMIARLLQDLGVSLDLIDHQDEGALVENLSQIAGLFYVPDATKAVDNKGRKIISAQNFVQQYQIKTVFGAGGLHLSTKTFITLIVFSRESIKKSQVSQFMPLTNIIAATGSDLIVQGKFFG